MKTYEIETILAQVGNRSDTATGTVNPPIYLSTAYRHAGIGQSTGYDYSRTGNPTRKILENAMAALEDGDAGFACSSGMAAITTILSLFATGDELLVSNDLYGGTYRLLEGCHKNWGLQCTYLSQFTIENMTKHLTHRTKAVFLETPTNPLMVESNIAEVAAFCQEHQLLLIVDNTFYTPVIQQPLKEGADIVIHSATKYLGGHNDVLAGIIVARGKSICEKLTHYLHSSGAVLSPFDSWLLIRGLKTLSLRMEKHEQNAKEILAFLANHDGVTDVLYPGRGGMISFRIRQESWINPLLQNLKLITFAESLGGVESFITYPATQTHADVPEELRLQRGVCHTLLRLSVGIESATDLKADLQQAFAKVMKEVRQ